MELNAEQIKKALECCASGTSAVACDGCPLRYEEGTCDDDSNYLLRQALALITSQEQRIKELTADLEAVRSRADETIDALHSEVRRLTEELEKRPPRLIITRREPK